jgi:SET domain-containing protein
VDPAVDHPLVRFTASPIQGMGGFARVPIEEGTEIIEYVGERISKEESSRRCEQNNPFIFGLDAEHDLDGNVPWNPARLINHSCTPNCEALDDEGRIWVVALRDIAPGEELTFNYGYSLEEYRDHPCRCGSSGCVGFMVAAEFHEVVRRNVAWREAGSPSASQGMTAAAAGAGLLGTN